MNRLEKFTNVAIIAMCVMTSAFLVRVSFFKPEPRAQEAPYEKGEIIPSVQGVDYSHSKGTVILVVSSNCHFCTESMAFYQALGKHARAENNSRFRLVVAGLQSERTLAEYVSRYGVDYSAVVTLNPEKVKFTATPLLVLVNAGGRVIRSYQGKMTAKQQSQLESDLDSLR